MFESIMWKYIDEEENVLNRVINNQSIKEISNKYSDIKNIYFISHGSSFNAGYTVAPFFARVANINVNVITAGNFVDEDAYARNINPKNSLVITISQTGNSRGTLLACKKARDNGVRTLGLTAKDNGKIVQYVDDYLCLCCDDEDSNAKTKGYSASLLTLLLLATEIGLLKKVIDDKDYLRIISDINREVSSLKNTKDNTLKFCKDNDFGKNLNNLYIFGSNMNYGSALECEIKLTETMCVPTVACDTIEFSHGIHRSINKNSTILIIRTKYNDQFALATFNHFKDKCMVYMINTLDVVDDKRVINIDDNDSVQSVLNVVEIIQILSVYGPEILGLDPNRDCNNDYADMVDTRI